jgi:hypothetical protein
MGYQLRTNIVKNENPGLLADSHSILNRWKNYFSQSLNVHNVGNLRQVEILCTFSWDVSTCSLSFWSWICYWKVKNMSPGCDLISAELIHARHDTLWPEIQKFIRSIRNKEELPEQWKKSIIVPIYNKGAKTDCSNNTHTHIYIYIPVWVLSTMINEKTTTINNPCTSAGTPLYWRHRYLCNWC